MKKPLLLHICCGPCSTTPIDLLNECYEIHGYFFNPNIFPETEYYKRFAQAESFFRKKKIKLSCADYDHASWLRQVNHLKNVPEGGDRCEVCVSHRLNQAAKFARDHDLLEFTTSITVGPRKPANVIFPIALTAAKAFEVNFLAIDFKKNDGYLKSCVISRQENMYRQNYCGCEFSLSGKIIAEF